MIRYDQKLEQTELFTEFGPPLAAGEKFKILAIGWASLFISSDLHARPFGSDHLLIEYEFVGEAGTEKLKDMRKTLAISWPKACKRLGENLLDGQGPWGYGIFTAYSCSKRGQRFSDQLRRNNWLLSITGSKSGLDFSFSFRAGGKTHTVGSLSLPIAKNIFRFMLDQELTDLIALALIDSLPAVMKLTEDNLHKDRRRIFGRHTSLGKGIAAKFKIPKPPKAILAYHLDFSQKDRLFKSKVLRRGVLGKITKPQISDDKRRRGRVVWRLKKTLPKADQPVYVHSSKGPNALMKTLRPIIIDALGVLGVVEEKGGLADFVGGQFDTLTDLIFGTAAGGYLGVRYGLQILASNDNLLKQTKFLGLLFEIRAGPLNGLRYYYDTLPKATFTEAASQGGELTSSMEYSRHVVGTSWGLDPGYLFDRVDITPKIGVWNFSSTLVIDRDEDGLAFSTKDFSLGNTLGLALELGVEINANWYSLRGWYSINSGIVIAGKGGAITSNGAGLDAFFIGGPTLPLFGLEIRSSIFGFLFAEQVVLVAEDVEKLDTVDEDLIEEVSYALGFGGLGVAISW